MLRRFANTFCQFAYTLQTRTRFLAKDSSWSSLVVRKQDRLKVDIRNLRKGDSESSFQKRHAMHQRYTKRSSVVSIQVDSTH